MSDPVVDGGSSGSAYSVAGLCAAVNDQVAAGFPDEVWVQGAISGLTRSGKGHVYFDLVDSVSESGQSTVAVAPVALFSSARQNVNRILKRAGGIRMHDGIEIRIRGRVTYYAPQARVQLVMSLIDPKYTLGQMANARRELLEALADEGLLTRNRELPFPSLPLNVGLVTSDQSAAYHDFVNELTSGGHPFRIALHDTRVQGLEAVAGLSAAIADAGQGNDVVVVVRGGGSRSDLVAFDHADVARAIARCEVPVVVGVGHDIDRSVADEVAHQSLKTPTAAASFLVEAVDRYSDRVRSAAERLEHLARWHVSSAQHQLIGNGNRLADAAKHRLAQSRMEMAYTTDRLTRAPAQALRQRQSDLRTSQARLQAFDPARALRRGWSITYRRNPDDGSRTLVTASGEVLVGDQLETVTASTTIISTVDETVDTLRQQ